MEVTQNKFPGLARRVTLRLPKVVAQDPGLRGAIDALARPDEAWWSGHSTEVVALTLEDYLADISTFLDGNLRAIAVDAVASHLFGDLLLSHLLRASPPLTARTLDRLEADEVRLMACLSLHGASRKNMDTAAKPLRILRCLLAADSPEEADAWYTQLLDLSPEAHLITPQSLERMIESRGRDVGRSKATWKAIRGALEVRYVETVTREAAPGGKRGVSRSRLRKATLQVQSQMRASGKLTSGGNAVGVGGGKHRRGGSSGGGGLSPLGKG